MSDLPKLTLKLVLPDPAYVPIFVEGEQWPINHDQYSKEFEVEVEVVQLNINSGGMRIRFEWPNKHRKSGMEMCSQDVSIEHFFNKYTIMEK